MLSVVAVVGMQWKRHDGVRLATVAMDTDHVTSVAECINNCAQRPACDSVNFRSPDKECDLMRHVTSRLTVNSGDLVIDSQSQWWSMSFTVVA